MSIVLDLTATFSASEAPRTPFGTYDSDLNFQSDADGFIRLVYRRLGGDIMQIELTNKDAYACLEQAMLEFSAISNTYQAKSVLLNLIGYPTGTMSGAQNKVPRFDLDFAKSKANGYGSEAGVGGTRPLYSASITLTPGMQSYDLNFALSSSGAVVGPAGGRAEIREIFHFDPVAAYRFFDTTSAVNYLNNQFSFESFTPETVFYMLPVWEDILRAQQMELSQKTRRSNYSYGLVNNVLSIYPTPTESSRGLSLYFTYFVVGTTGSLNDNDPYTNGVANLTNIPFGNLNYSQINSIGKQWVKKMALAFAKETLGQIRGKMATIPIPNGDVTLNGPQLVQEGLVEQENLRQELKDWLDSMTYQKLMEQQQNEAEMVNRVLMRIPSAIFVRINYEIKNIS
jgi:hypothetical protein